MAFALSTKLVRSRVDSRTKDQNIEYAVIRSTFTELLLCYQLPYFLDLPTGASMEGKRLSLIKPMVTAQAIQQCRVMYLY